MIKEMVKEFWSSLSGQHFQVGTSSLWNTPPTSEVPSPPFAEALGWFQVCSSGLFHFSSGLLCPKSMYEAISVPVVMSQCPEEHFLTSSTLSENEFNPRKFLEEALKETWKTTTESEGANLLPAGRTQGVWCRRDTPSSALMGDFHTHQAFLKCIFSVPPFLSHAPRTFMFFLFEHTHTPSPTTTTAAPGSVIK